MAESPRLQHVNVKVFLQEADSIPLEDFIPVFHSWIQQRKLDDLLIDVADYRHVPSGPGVLLIGHNAHYSIDLAEGDAGILYNRKTVVDAPPARQITRAIETALQVCRLLADETVFQGRIRPDTHRMRFIVNDRLLAANDTETLERLKPHVVEALSSLFGAQDYAFRLDPEPRKRFTADVALPGGFPFP